MMSKKTNKRARRSATIAVLGAIVPLMLLGVLHAQFSDASRGFEPRLGASILFPDLDPASREGLAASRLAAKGIIGGFPDGTFRAQEPVNRAQAAKILLYAAELPIHDLKNDSYFTDVVDGEWYVPYVLTAAGYKVIDGYPDFSFRPANQINTAEFLKMLTNALQLETGLPYSYADVPSGEWYATYVGIAAKYTLFPDRPTLLQPGRLLTRGEVIVAVDRALNGGVDPDDGLHGAAGDEPMSSDAMMSEWMQPSSSAGRYIPISRGSLPSGYVSEQGYPRPRYSSRSHSRSSGMSSPPYEPEGSRSYDCENHPECMSSRSSSVSSESSESSEKSEG